jgi:hypothetical protein
MQGSVSRYASFIRRRVRKKGELAGIFEYDGETEYFFLHDYEPREDSGFYSCTITRRPVFVPHPMDGI